jgi:hypothetical protein
MFKCLFQGIALTAVAMIILALPPSPTFAAVCSPPGEIVVTDPAGDGPSPEADILDVAIQEVVAGVYAGKLIVTLRASALGDAPSGLWLVQWKDVTGNNTTTFSMSACDGAAGFTYSYETPEATDSGSPDGGSYTAGGTMEWIIARDKIGSPANGETFEQISAIANAWVSVPPVGCLPQAGTDGTAQGRYVVGSCLVDAPANGPSVALRLGAPAPNPARSDVSLALDVPAALTGQPFEVGMFDVSGRRQGTIASGAAVPGRTTLRWDLRNARGERVRPGTYWARITVGGERRTRVFVVR